MSYPKQPGDPEAHRQLAARHLEVVLELKQLRSHLSDLIRDWQAGNVDTKDMAKRLHLLVETQAAADAKKQG